MLVNNWLSMLSSIGKELKDDDDDGEYHDHWSLPMQKREEMSKYIEKLFRTFWVKERIKLCLQNKNVFLNFFFFS